MKNIEKQAKELVDKFRAVSLKLYNVNPEFEDLFYLSETEAKQCAIICCDSHINFMINTLNWSDEHNGNVQYWQQVKDYIQSEL